MKRNFKSYLSIGKKLANGLLNVIIFPVYFFWPKYERYIFVLTTGRSGSGALANSFKGCAYVNANHEPHPRMFNYLFFSDKTVKIWYWFMFYFIKYPTILLSCKRENKIYFETNHLFIKSFAPYAVRTFGNKMGVIHLQREPYKVAKSMYEVGVTPGEKQGMKWYLDPYANNNLLKYDYLIKKLGASYEPAFDNLYKNLWYWFEIEKRIEKFKLTYPSIKVLELKTSQLGNRQSIVDGINDTFGLKLPSADHFVQLDKVDKNLKLNEKKNYMDMEKAKEVTEIFQTVVHNQTIGLAE